MAHLIDKDRVVAEIDRRMQELRPTNTHKMQVGEKVDRDVLMWLNALTWVKKVINTLEEKDVDLEKELDKWYNNEASKDFENVLYKDIEKCAEHFFELGLKAQVKYEDILLLHACCYLSVWHEYNESIDANRPFLHISKKGHLSIMLWNGQSLKSMTFGCDSCCVICKGDKFAYIDELCLNNRHES